MQISTHEDLWNALQSHYTDPRGATQGVNALHRIFDAFKTNFNSASNAAARTEATEEARAALKEILKDPAKSAEIDIRACAEDIGLQIQETLDPDNSTLGPGAASDPLAGSKDSNSYDDDDDDPADYWKRQ